MSVPERLSPHPQGKWWSVRIWEETDPAEHIHIRISDRTKGYVVGWLAGRRDAERQGFCEVSRPYWLLAVAPDGTVCRSASLNPLVLTPRFVPLAARLEFNDVVVELGGIGSGRQTIEGRSCGLHGFPRALALAAEAALRAHENPPQEVP